MTNIHIHKYAFFIISVNYIFTVVYGDTFHDGTVSNAEIANLGSGRHFSHFGVHIKKCHRKLL